MEEKTLTKTIKVEEEQLAVSMGSGGLAVLATPAVTALMENAAFELCEEILNNDELTTVGTAISIEHRSPTPSRRRDFRYSRIKKKMTADSLILR